jgi:TonB family protein
VDVTDVLRDRLEPPGGLQRMITLSLVAHAAVLIALVFAGNSLLGSRSSAPATVMTISLGGAGEGPLNGGMSAASARAVQTVAPKEELKRQDAFAPPAATKPEMVMPTNRVTTKPPKPAPVVKEAPEGARGRTPTRGTERAFGQALTYTGAKGQGFGLSTGGGPGSGSTLDVADFCCPDYIATMIDRIRSVWQHNQGVTGTVKIKFTIQRDGRIADVIVETSSGNTLLDTAAQRAVLQTRTLNPLPSQFPNPTLGVHLNFEYQ